MENNLGEIFYNGKIVDLQNMQKAQTMEILNDLRDKQAISKEKIDICLDKMRNI